MRVGPRKAQVVFGNANHVLLAVAVLGIEGVRHVLDLRIVIVNLRLRLVIRNAQIIDVTIPREATMNSNW